MRKINKYRKVGEKMYIATKKQNKKDELILTPEQIECLKKALEESEREWESGFKGYTPEEVYEYINKKIDNYIKEKSNENI